MLSLIKRNPIAVTLAILLHLAIVFFLIFGMEWELFPKRAQPKANVVQAHAVDAAKLHQAEAEAKAKERKQHELEVQKRKQAEAKKQKIAEEKKRKAEQVAKQKAEAKRKAVAKQKAEAEAKRQAAEKQKAEAEAKRQAAEKQKAEAEAKRQAQEAAARAEREQALQEQLAAEQNAREIDRYVAVIKQQIERNWLRPGQSGQQLSCTVQVRLIPGGDVVPGGVSIIKSSGNGAFDRSVEAAVYKAAPLPVPSGPLFESFRNLRLNFKPN